MTSQWVSSHHRWIDGFTDLRGDQVVATARANQGSRIQLEAKSHYFVMLVQVQFVLLVELVGFVVNVSGGSGTWHCWLTLPMITVVAQEPLQPTLR